MNAKTTKPLEIETFVAEAPNQTRVDEWMHERKAPIIEGNSATFLWRGDADAVRLRHFIFGLESANPLQRVEGTNLWFITMEIPANSRVEYKLEIERGKNTRWIEDPLNDARARDPFGANSVCQGEGYERPEWTHRNDWARRGKLEPLALFSETFRQMRHGQVYLPARFRPSRRYPLLVVHDGSDYLNYASMGIVLDNLIDRLEIPDLIACFIDSPDRLHEYPGNADHAKFVTEELVPHLETNYPLRGTPRSRCLMGASFGGVASLSAAYRYPGFWGRLVLQSGSFAFSDIGHKNHRGPAFDPVVRFMNDFRANVQAVSERVYVSCGTYESLIYENRSLIPLLDDTGMEVRFTEARDGHNWENWRDRLREGLSYVFPGPLLMIYE